MMSDEDHGIKVMMVYVVNSCTNIGIGSELST